MYRIVTVGVVAELPGAALAGYAQIPAVLELTPWNGTPINAEGNVRVLPFGDAGMVIYLTLEDQQRVDLLELIWGPARGWPQPPPAVAGGELISVVGGVFR